MKLEISSLNKEDLRHCAELYVETFQAHPWNESWSLVEALERLSDLFDVPKLIALKAWLNGEICGFLMGRLQTWPGEISCDVEEICIAERFQRQGVGRSLMARLEAILKSRGVSGVSLVTQKRSGPSVFYKKLNYKDDPGLVVMRKEIE